jgi:hypothetical protein
MSHKHEKTLEHLYQHPIAMNIKWNDVVHMFEALGGRVEPSHGGREKVFLNGKEMTFHVPHSRTLDSKDEVMQVRHFLTSCGVEPK